MTINELEQRLINLERAFIQSQQNNVEVVAKADSTVILNNTLQTVSEQTVQNSDDILMAMDGITDTYEMADMNYSDIAECMDALIEIYEMLG